MALLIVAAGNGYSKSFTRFSRKKKSPQVKGHTILAPKYSK